MGSLVGQTESRTRQALKIIDSMGPSVVCLDEVDKAFGSATGGGNGDSGVSSRMFGTFLTRPNLREPSGSTRSSLLTFPEAIKRN